MKKYIGYPIGTIVLCIVLFGLFDIANNYRIAINKVAESNIDTRELLRELKECKLELQKISKKCEQF